MTNIRQVLVRGGVSTKGAQIGKRVVTRACAQKLVPPKVLPNYLLKNAISAP